MALFNHAKREINAKIVYFGVAGTGKRTSMQYVYSRIKPTLRGTLKPAPGSDDSLHSFDFSPFEHQVFGGFRLRFHMYTLTGAVANPAAWKMILKGADGIIVSAEAVSSAYAAGRDSVMSLRTILSSYGSGLDMTPCVLQLTGKEAASAMTADAIAAELGLPGVAACFADPASGVGVLDALSRLSRLVVDRIGQDDGLKSHTPVVGRNEASEIVSGDAGNSDCGFASEEPLPMQEQGPSVEENAVSGCQVKVALAGDEAECRNSVVRIPLEIWVGESRKRLVVSMSVELE